MRINPTIPNPIAVYPIFGDIDIFCFNPYNKTNQSNKDIKYDRSEFHIVHNFFDIAFFSF